MKPSSNLKRIVIVLPMLILALVETSYFSSGDDFLQMVPDDIFTAPKQNPVIELAVFVDYPMMAIRTLRGFEDKKGMDTYVEILVKGLNSLYSQMREESRLRLHLVYYEVLRKKTVGLYGETDAKNIIKWFSIYQYRKKKYNVEMRWDHALLVTGVDLILQNQTYEGEVTGYGWSGSMCTNSGSISIVEGWRGFASVMYAAHEIGHNLGLTHDGDKNKCFGQHKIMSNSYSPAIQPLWSSCSQKQLAVLIKYRRQHTCLYTLHDRTEKPSKVVVGKRINSLPGQLFNISRQCTEALGPTSKPYTEKKDVCKYLYCTLPKKSLNLFISPALDGSSCGFNKICSLGKCVSEENIRVLY